MNSESFLFLLIFLFGPAAKASVANSVPDERERLR